VIAVAKVHLWIVVAGLLVVWPASAAAPAVYTGPARGLVLTATTAGYDTVTSTSGKAPSTLTSHVGLRAALSTTYQATGTPRAGGRTLVLAVAIFKTEPQATTAYGTACPQCAPYHAYPAGWRYKSLASAAAADYTRTVTILARCRNVIVEATNTT
jgi:hypothetical protein